MENFQILANWKEAKNTKDENTVSWWRKIQCFSQKTVSHTRILEISLDGFLSTLDCIKINDISEDFDDSIIQRVGHRLTCLNQHQSYKWKNGQIYF